MTTDVRKKLLAEYLLIRAESAGDDKYVSISVADCRFIAETLVSPEVTCSGGDWQCRDYADGWITFPNRQSAEKYQEETGALMRYRRYYPAPVPQGSAELGGEA